MKFKHKAFLKEIKGKEVPEVPEQINEMIKAFEEIEEAHNKGDESDQKELTPVLKQLDLDIEEELHDFYEDYLDNNEIVEEVERKLETKSEKKEVAPKSLFSEDEKILEELYNEGIKIVSPEILVKKGFKPSTHVCVIKFTNYKLTRISLFHANFRIEKI